MVKINLREYQKWLERRNLSEKTVLVYSWSLQEYGEREVNTTEIIKFFKENLTRYQPHSLQCFRKALSSYSKFGKIFVEWELITRLIPTIQQKPFPTIDETELEKLKKIKPKTKSVTNQRNELILDLLFWTGLRIGELVNIRHCDFKDKSLKIKGKGNKVRFIPIPEFLEKHFNESSDYLFKSFKNQKLNEKAIRSMISRRNQQAGINKNITPHTFRRSFATLSNNSGIRLTTIQKILGHSDIETTISYIHDSYKDIYQDYSKLWITPR